MFICILIKVWTPSPTFHNIFFFHTYLSLILRVTNHNSLKHALIIRYYIFNIAIGGARGLPKGAMDPLILKFSINFLLCLVINLKISPKHCFPLEEAWREGVFGSGRDWIFKHLGGVWESSLSYVVLVFFIYVYMKKHVMLFRMCNFVFEITCQTGPWSLETSLTRQNL